MYQINNLCIEINRLIPVQLSTIILVYPSSPYNINILSKWFKKIIIVKKFINYELDYFISILYNCKNIIIVDMNIDSFLRKFYDEFIEVCYIFCNDSNVYRKCYEKIVNNVLL